jgi:PilZ domain
MVVSEAQPSNGRRTRRPVEMRGQLVRAGGITHIVHLIDINYGGCGIQTPVELQPGESVQLMVMGRGSLAATVRWYEDGRAGLEFEPLPDKKVVADRGANRVDVGAQVGLKVLGHNTFRVRIFDLSTAGCRVELIEVPSIGDHMFVKFDSIEPMEALVCWLEGHTAGLKFEKPIHPAVLDMILQRLSTN